MKRFLLILLLVVPAHSQSWDDMAGAKIIRLDRMMHGADKMNFFYPPEGKYWVITAGSFTTQRPVLGAGFTVSIEEAPFAPFRDPLTGEMRGCHTACLTILRADAGAYTFFPIVGGYMAEGGTRQQHGYSADVINGQTMPIVVAYPNRLNLILNGLSDTDAIQTYTRLYVIERPIPSQ